MRKVILVIPTLLIFSLTLNAYAAAPKLMDIRSKIFEESKQIKSTIASSKDPLVISSLWDSCLMTITQIDAYFSMVGIFNEIKKEDVTKSSVNYLIDWLGGIKTTNEMNLRSLDLMPPDIEPNIKAHIEKLRAYFVELNNVLNSEANKNILLKKAVKK